MTPKQKRLYNFVVKYIEENGNSPSYEEMRKFSGYKSLSSVYQIIHRLKKQNYIELLPSCARSIKVNENRLLIDCMEFINSKNLRKEFESFRDNIDLHRGLTQHE